MKLDLKSQRQSKEHQPAINAGFTLLEVLVTIVIVGILATIGSANWLRFVENQRVGAARSDLYASIRSAQERARASASTWRFSIRADNNGDLEYAYFSDPDNPPSNGWTSLSEFIEVDTDRTTNEDNSSPFEWSVDFDDRGQVTPGDQGRVTLVHTNSPAKPRCIFVSTILGAMRTAEGVDCPLKP
ncbi:prepilin-type N-terminal cleavage/methylation domain protein [Rubidibacter lacunae KORDI 51-2]|uniref:Prepilin-type N-terminal cleavage/methylation domain protein n=1 Tax=Rubidibacter lacunae KORDI 51-2 TaxID=582515 RepID=U5DED2_9CHRO|nr:GspH/FimT family pseudopilin [Rubidibacter lacunae]ERN39981.1 prepilin-type N-terminal cleavage/methylation domain protein [Rubidibacter lacunae KORDI 51-2]